MDRRSMDSDIEASKKQSHCRQSSRWDNILHKGSFVATTKIHQDKCQHMIWLYFSHMSLLDIRSHNSANYRQHTSMAGQDIQIHIYELWDQRNYPLYTCIHSSQYHYQRRYLQIGRNWPRKFWLSFAGKGHFQDIRSSKYDRLHRRSKYRDIHLRICEWWDQRRREGIWGIIQHICWKNCRRTWYCSIG